MAWADLVSATGANPLVRRASGAMIPDRDWAWPMSSWRTWRLGTTGRHGRGPLVAVTSAVCRG